MGVNDEIMKRDIDLMWGQTDKLVLGHATPPDHKNLETNARRGEVSNAPLPCVDGGTGLSSGSPSPVILDPSIRQYGAEASVTCVICGMVIVSGIPVSENDIRLTRWAAASHRNSHHGSGRFPSTAVEEWRK